MGDPWRAPPGLQAKRFRAGGEEWLVLTFPAPANDLELASLSPRERNLALAIVDGFAIVAIAENLGESALVVRNLIRALFRKLRVHSRLELARLLVQGARPK
jgi:DNA-binding NarL/FixJ family response regulator